MSRSVSTIVVALLLQLALPRWACAVQWVNETDLSVEADYVNLQFPTSLNLQTSQSSGLIYGQIYEAGLTNVMGSPANTLAELGYGPGGSDPRTSPDWNWVTANYNLQVANNDEFYLALTAPAVLSEECVGFRSAR
jgi:hypothetical protein